MFIHTKWRKEHLFFYFFVQLPPLCVSNFLSTTKAKKLASTTLSLILIVDYIEERNKFERIKRDKGEYVLLCEYVQVL